jgi:hypothetical protein
MLRAAVGAAGSAAGCSCSCGGSGCSCGASGGSATTAAAVQTRMAMPIACAPTVTCETYRYEVFRAPAAPDCSGQTPLPPGRLAQQVLACAGDIVTLLQHPPQEPLGAKLSPAGIAAWSQYCTQLRAALYTHFTRSGTAQCEELTQLCQIACPPATSDAETFSNAMEKVGTALLPLVLAAIQDCICLAALPPCPDPQQDPRVPLAVITVSGMQNCTVVDICNWTPLRPIVGTFPNLGYWLSVFNLVTTLRNSLFCFCCEQLQIGGRLPGALAQPRAAAAPADAVSPFAQTLPSLGLIGKWLGDKGADIHDLLTSLNVAPAPGAVDALTQRVAALEAELANLRAERPADHS